MNDLMRLSGSLVLVVWTMVSMVGSVWAHSTESDQVPVQFTIVGNWEIQIKIDKTPKASEQRVKVEPSETVVVTDESHPELPLFQPSSPGWAKGLRLMKLRAQETTTPHLLIPESVKVSAPKGKTSQFLVRGIDYELDEVWGTVGRLQGGQLADGQRVKISYQYLPLRIDAVLLDATGKVLYRKGTPRAAAPHPPEPEEGEELLGHIWFHGKIEKLNAENLFPVLEKAHPQPQHAADESTTKLAKTLAKLKSGEKLTILAWGDSVTDARYLQNRDQEAWQNQFVQRLRNQYPKANIHLVTEAWGGRNTGSYLAEPPGSEHNYQEKVLAVKPDLIVSEFVNDAGLKTHQVKQRYGKLLADFQSMGTVWIILTPHYTYKGWMGFKNEREVDDDPREYVNALREFGKTHPVVIADAAARYGRLWRQGMPYSSLMLNSINHPDARGMKIFADALIAVFP